MAAPTHNPSRRAVLGAAVMLPLMGPSRHCEERSDAAIQPGLLRSARNDDEKWRRTLGAYRGADAALRECERRTAGAPWEEQEAVEEEYGARLDALYAALRRLLRAPAPDLGALAVKIELMIEHEVATLDGGDACLAAIRRDAWRLAAGSGA